MPYTLTQHHKYTALSFLKPFFSRIKENPLFVHISLKNSVTIHLQEATMKTSDEFSSLALHSFPNFL